MKPFLALVLCSLLPAFTLAGPRDDFYKLLDDHQECGSNLLKKPKKAGLKKKMLALLENWSQRSPRDVEVKIAYSNLYFSESRSEVLNISTKPAGPGDLSLTSDETGKEAGSIGSMIQYDPALMQKAIDPLKQAVVARPERLDIHFGLAHLYREAGRWDEHYAVIARAVGYVQANPKLSYRLMNDKPLKDPPQEYVLETVQTYIREHFDADAPANDAMVLKLSGLLMDKYPQSPYGFNSTGAYYAGKRDWKTALLYMEKARQRDPKDTLVLMNMGIACANLHRVPDARKHFEEVIRSSPDKDMVQNARDRLGRLKGN